MDYPLRKTRPLAVLLLVAALVLGFMATCERERPKPSPPYNPSSGDHVWRQVAATSSDSASPSPSPSPSVAQSPLPPGYVGTPGPTRRSKANTPPSAGAPTEIVFVGDSITAGWLLATQYRIDAQVRYRLPNVPVRNLAQGGMQVLNTDGSGDPDLAGTIDGVLTNMIPGDILAIDDGMDDVWSYDGDQAWTAAYSRIVSKALAAGMRVLVGSITPLGSVNSLREPLREHLNSWLASVYADRFVDFSAPLHDTRTGQVWMDVRFAWYDGVHPNEGGTAVMADAVVQKIAAEGWITP